MCVYYFSSLVKYIALPEVGFPRKFYIHISQKLSNKIVVTFRKSNFRQNLSNFCYIFARLRLKPEKGIDEDDLAGRNVFLAVALGLCAAVAPTCCSLITGSKKVTSIIWEATGTLATALSLCRIVLL